MRSLDQLINSWQESSLVAGLDNWLGSSKTFFFWSSTLGINIFLDGFVPTENLRFRESSLVFKVSETATDEEIKRMCRYEYENMVKNMGELTIQWQ